MIHMFGVHNENHSRRGKICTSMEQNPNASNQKPNKHTLNNTRVFKESTTRQKQPANASIQQTNKIEFIKMSM